MVKRIADITEVTIPGGSVKLGKEIRDAAQKSEVITGTTNVAPTAPTPVAPHEDGGEENPPADTNLHDGSNHFRSRTRSYWENLPPEPADERGIRLRRLAVEEPNGAVLVAFSEMEVPTRGNYVQRYGEEDRCVSFGKIVKIFQSDKILPIEVASLLLELGDIRKQVAHNDTRIASEVAESYIEAVGNMIGFLVQADLLGYGRPPS